MWQATNLATITSKSQEGSSRLQPKWTVKLGFQSLLESHSLSCWMEPKGWKMGLKMKCYRRRYQSNFHNYEQSSRRKKWQQRGISSWTIAFSSPSTKASFVYSEMRSAPATNSRGFLIRDKLLPLPVHICMPNKRVIAFIILDWII